MGVKPLRLQARGCKPYVGIDVGLKDFAILSDGTIYSNPKFLRRLEEKLSKTTT